MKDENDGPAIARRRIAEEAAARTGVLDLGRLGLTALPDELFRLTHLRRLNLGDAIGDEDGFWRASADIAANAIESSLERLRALPELQVLSVRGSRLASLTGIAGLTGLRRLDCSETGVRDLGPLAGLPALQDLNASGCPLADLPQRVLYKPSLEKLVLYDSRLPGVPAAVLSQSWTDNCLESLRAHVRDLAAGAVEVADVKLMVLGNGRVGKTQLCRRLRSEAYDETEPSTHGVRVTSAPVPAAEGEPAARLQIWDFGGQDIYHGTHALFLRSNAIFLLVWTPALEEAREQRQDGLVFRNHPLAYWVEYVRHLGASSSPVLVVQTRCDRPQDRAVCPVPDSTLAEAFAFHEVLRYSARTERGRPALDQALAEAAAWLRDQEGIAVIGAGRARVKARLEAMRDADAALPPEQRHYRTITQAQFRRLCAEAGGIGAPEHLLTYLHNAGIVFYRPGLFNDEIILDQSWALDAIYAVFHRERCYTKIRRQHGRFTRVDLEDWVWRERGHSVGEQKLFLSMMESCGICFAHRRWGGEDEDQTEYIAPDLLPARADLQVELEQKWDDDLPAETAAFDYPLLHPGLMRSVISRIGAQAGIDATYWQGGVYVYETKTRSRGLIEQEMSEGWRGRIRLRTQRGQAAVLLERLTALVEWEHRRAGLTPVKVTAPAAARGRVLEEGDRPAAGPGRDAAPGAKLVFGQEPSPGREYYVSYAWRDDTPEGQKREDIVDRLCADAQARGIRILRDKDVMGLGDRISKFMQRIGQGDRVFIVLSDKYLKSPFCMYELFEVWRNSRQEDAAFLQRIRVYTLPCARIWELSDRLDYAIYWKEKYGAVESRVRQYGDGILGDVGEKSFQQYRLMRRFSSNVADVLATVADSLQPRSFDELVKYGFEDGCSTRADAGSS